MFEKKQTPLIVILVAVPLVLLAVALGWRLVRGDSQLLRNVRLESAEITPNADGVGDITYFNYQLSRNGRVSITFTDENGQEFVFRQDRLRGIGDYRVAFSGIVDGFSLPDDEVEGQILTRLLPNGRYTWRITATDENEASETAKGVLTISQADNALPDMRDFTLDRPIFTPNRDGVDDRILAQFFLTKDVEELRVFLVTEDGAELPISEYEQNVPANQVGWHYYDYEGGVDDGATPPPDGTYPIVAIARDAEGQQVRVENELTIQYGGVPRAQIFPPPAGDTVSWNATAVALCDTLYFTLTVENYGTTPIRTSGPEPGIVYDSEWNYNTLGWHTESGVFRVGIGFENEISNYPYRWAVGNPEDLEEIDGRYYLMPGARATITGGIRMTNVFGDRNPQPVWAGLIHEDVEISQFNSRVDPVSILVDVPDSANMPTCEPREVPVRINP